MTALEIDKALTNIVLQMQSECENKLNSIEKDLKMERKAVQIELGMYSLCLRAGLLYHTIGTRESTLKHFQNQANKIFASFPVIVQKYSEADEKEKLIMVASLRQEAFMRDQFSNKNESDYQKARKVNSVDDMFELKIKINATNKVYEAWEQWRKNTGIYPNMFG